MSVALVTRGMIRSCFKRDQIVSCTSPEFQSVLEVRPRIRNVASVPPAIVPVPVQIVVQELRPTTEAKSPSALSPVTSPTQTSVQELKPIIKKVEED